MAIKCLTRSQQITVAKLIHNLANTNVQNHRYYNKSPKCPCCTIVDETLDHVLSCTSAAATEHRKKALHELQQDLQLINTPIEVRDAISHGISLWLIRQTEPNSNVRALTAGSHKGTDMLLTMAFNEQFHTIGWHNMFHGRLSKKWGKAVYKINKSSRTSLSTTWTAQTILYLWKYSRSLWMHSVTIILIHYLARVIVEIKG
jgi:hypothetical protein